MEADLFGESGTEISSNRNTTISYSSTTPANEVPAGEVAETQEKILKIHWLDYHNKQVKTMKSLQTN